MVQIANPPQPASGRWRFRRSVAENADGGGHFLAAAVRHYGRNADFSGVISHMSVSGQGSVGEWSAPRFRFFEAEEVKVARTLPVSNFHTFSRSEEHTSELQSPMYLV